MKQTFQNFRWYNERILNDKITMEVSIYVLWNKLEELYLEGTLLVKMKEMLRLF